MKNGNIRWIRVFFILASVVGALIVTSLQAATTSQTEVLPWDPMPRDLYHRKGAAKPSAGSLELWARADFSPIDTKESLVERIQAIKIVAQGWKVDQLQVEVLRDAIFALVMGYAAPDYATYAKFRFPVEDGTWHEGSVEFNRELLAKIFADRAAEFADMTPRELFEEQFYYTLIRLPTQSRRRAPVDESLRTVGVIREMAADASLILIERRTTMPSPLYEVVVSTANNGIGQRFPSCLINPRPDAVLESEGTLDVATIRLMLKTRNDPGMPHFLRFYWLPKEQKWAPYEYYVASPTRDPLAF